MKSGRWTVPLLAVVVALVVVGAFLLLPGVDMAGLRSAVAQVWSFLEGHPVLLYLGMVFLPALPIPQSPMLVLAGIVYAEPCGEIGGAALAASAVALNILWTYFLTVGPLRRVLTAFLSRFGYRLPQLPESDFLKFSFLVRVTPVLPLCVQNYTLGLLRVPLRLYLLASWSTQVPLAFAIALTAGAILEGSLGVILIAVAVLLLLVFVLKAVRRKLRRDQGMAAVSDELAAETVGRTPGEGIQ